MIFFWREISSVPAEPGVYAWYYRLDISTFDVDATVENIKQANANGDAAKSEIIMRNFLLERIFRYFEEDPYIATIRGPLKPKYHGTLHQQSQISDSLIERLVQSPERLFIIKSVLHDSAPLFASPLYIGMSDKLRSRLARHKVLIERAISNPSKNQPSIFGSEDPETLDNCFAHSVAERRIPPTNLFVVVQPMTNVGDAHIDIENILNRINFPLLGRN